MKSIHFFVYVFCFYIGLNSHLLSSQNDLNIDSVLKANSTPIKIKRKGISAIGKYEFDGYRLIFGKSGWTTTKSNTSFKSNSKTTSQNKKSFVFTNQVNDSVIVNIATNSEAEILVDSIINISLANDHVSVEVKNNFFNRTFFKWNGRTLKKGVEIYVANFLFLKDSTSWNLSIKSPLLVDVDGVFQTDLETEFEALLSNGIQDIVIKQIEQIENTKISFLRGPALGYEFYLNDKAIAALQYHSPDRLFIWLHNTLDEKLKFVIASASTAILVKEF
jgi:hypothetical protein